MKKLFLDDKRQPAEVFDYIPQSIYLDKDWIVVKNHVEFLEYISKHGIPDLVSFDHDLHDSHYVPQQLWDNYDASETYQNNLYPYSEFENGVQCARELVAHCKVYDLPLPICLVHTMNPVGGANIISVLQRYKESRRKVCELIVATKTGDCGIGYKGDLPWGRDQKDDLKYFKETTMGGVLVMGSATWDGFNGRPLPGRDHLIITRDPERYAAVTQQHPQVKFTTFDGLLKYLDQKAYGDKKVFIAGGAKLYTAALKWRLVNKVHHTLVDNHELPADVYFKLYDNLLYYADESLDLASQTTKVVFNTRAPENKDHKNAHHMRIQVFNI